MNRTIKIIAIVLGVIIVILIGVLIFVHPAKGPTITQGLQISLPQANAIVTSPAAIEGTVTGGGWFFEASFPIKILDSDGTVLGQGTAQALSDWMSTGTVPFSASIPFTTPHDATGTIVFSKDNPSGAPENDMSFSIPISFITTGAGASSGIRGSVTLGPTCPVEKNPPDPQCADKPYSASLVVTTADGSRAIKNFQSTASGTFSVDLPAGQYTIESSPGNILPRCSSNGIVIVKSNTYTQANISCDTGIR